MKAKPALAPAVVAMTAIKMKPAEGLSDDEIKALVAHVRTFKK